MKALKLTTIKSNLFILLFCILFPFKLEASYIMRDAESEQYIRYILDDILKVAGINPKSVNLFLLNENSINAFVFGGSNIFIHTGLIQSFNNYEAIQGVLAHEVGHIKASHIISFDAKMDSILLEALLYSISGILIGATGGLSTALIVGLAAGTNVINKSALSYSRAQEREADFYAFQFLQRLKSSGLGMMQVFSKFKAMQDRYINPSDAEEYKYYTTHPFPQDRLLFFQEKFKQLNYTPVVYDKYQKQHNRVRAKLAGYLGNLKKGNDSSFLLDKFSAKYYLGFVYLRKMQFKKAQTIFEDLLKQEEDNPYLYEVLSEIYSKTKQNNKAIFYMKRALNLKPKEFLFLLEIAQLYVLTKEYDLAIKFMKQAQVQEPFNPIIPFYLAKIYNLKGEKAIAEIYFIESQIATRNYKKAKVLLKSFKRKNYQLISPFDVKIKDIEYFLQKK